MGLPGLLKTVLIGDRLSRFDTQIPAYDGQTDGRTDVQPIAITCFSIADARKNYCDDQCCWLHVKWHSYDIDKQRLLCNKLECCRKSVIRCLLIRSAELTLIRSNCYSGDAAIRFIDEPSWVRISSEIQLRSVGLCLGVLNVTWMERGLLVKRIAAYTHLSSTVYEL